MNYKKLSEAEMVKINLIKIDGMRCRIEALMEFDGQTGKYSVLINRKAEFTFTKDDISSKLLENGTFKFSFGDRVIWFVPDGSMFIIRAWFEL